MRSLLGDPSPVEHQDPVCGAHRLQAVRDHDQRLVARKRAQAPLKGQLVDRVGRRDGLVPGNPSVA